MLYGNPPGALYDRVPSRAGIERLVSAIGVVVAHAVSIAQAAETANLVEWAKLALNSPQARVLRVTRIRYDAPGCPIALEEIVLALDRFPGLTPDGVDIPDISELARRYGLWLGRATERVSVIQATKVMALHLGIAMGSDVLKLERIAETVDGEPLEWRVAFGKI
jgi:GntR family transcriptional regulator